MKMDELVKRYRVVDGTKFRLADIDPADTWKLKAKDQAHDWLACGWQNSAACRRSFTPRTGGRCC